MDVLETLGHIGRFLARAFLIIATLLAWQWVTVYGRRYRRRAGGLADPTVIAGMVAGLAVLSVLLPWQVLNWNAIVPVGGFWDLNLGEFFDLTRAMALHGPSALLRSEER